jgi:deoxyribodipyrimidine photo-lyase
MLDMFSMGSASRRVFAPESGPRTQDGKGMSAGSITRGTAATAEQAPTARTRTLNEVPARPGGAFVVYWMTAFRRLSWNHALDRAVALATRHARPLIILEALRVDYPWSSARTHRFIMDGMADHARRLSRTPVAYFPFVEPSAGAGRGLLEALAADAVAVVGDDWPGFFHPRMLAAAARLPCRVEVVDSCGLLPLRAASRAFPTAHAFRRFLQGVLPAHLADMPDPEPLRRLPAARPPIPSAVLERWSPTPLTVLESGPPDLRFARAVAPVTLRGGAAAATERLDGWLATRLSRYAEERNAPDADAASGLSSYLHFGHTSTWQILARLAAAEGWAPDRVARTPTGRREGWWGVGRSAEAFLDQLVTWRELGLNAAVHLPGYQAYESVPDWARRTLAEHAADHRPHRYDLADLDGGRTHDRLWNAAQRQLREEGTIDGYLRMLWGKKVLEWSPSPEAAAETLIELNNRYALDGRDPNSYSGIYWCFGRYDRPWGPSRAIFGTVRYMSSANTARRLPLAKYLDQYGS